MPHDPRTTLLSAALAAAERRWRVHPLRPGDKAPALHGERHCPGTGDCAGGHRKWEARATCDPDRIRQAWSTGPFNVGIATGPSGLVVIDLDTLKPQDEADTPDGVTAFLALCERAEQPTPVTYTVRTYSGGLHLYFTAPPDVRLPSTKGTLAKKIDTRAWGGNIVAVGSIIHGSPYQLVSDAPMAPLPGWLHTALTPAPRAAKAVAPGRPNHVNRYAHTALERERKTVAGAEEGEREATLFKAARAMGRFIAWGDLTRTEVEAAFQAAAESTGLPPSQCRATLRSALNWSIRTARPRSTT